MACELPYGVEMQGPCVGRNHAQRHISVAVCLLAFIFQLTAPFIHTWDASAQRMHPIVTELTLPLPVGQTHSAAVSATADSHSYRSLHNAMVCPICQTLASLRYWIITRSGSLWILILTVWLRRLLVCCPGHLSHYVIVARAPPGIAS